MPPTDLPTVEEVYALHQEIEEVYDLAHTGIRTYFPNEKIEQVLDRAERAEGVFERAAILMKDLANVHVFEDGNKRTAWMATYEYLERHDIEPAPDNEQVPLVMKRISRFDYSELATWLETGAIDENWLK